MAAEEEVLTHVTGFDFAVSCQFWIDEDTTAIFANDNLLVHLYFHLALCRDTVEAATTCITLHIHHAESVASILADTLERGEKA